MSPVGSAKVRRLHPGRPVRGSRVLLLSALLVGALSGAARGTPSVAVDSLFPGGRAPVAVGPAPRGTGSADAAGCAACHAEIAAEWRASMHSAAWTDEVFQAAYAVEPMAFCRNCHAPANAHAEPRGAAADDGVSCAVCHVRDEHVLATRRSGSAPHPVMAVRAMGESRYCAGCHQFNFPGDTGRGGAHFETGEPMQDTYAEWLDSAAAAEQTQCQGCHMPWVDDARGGRHRSHRFPGGRDLALLRSALDVSVTARVEGDHTLVTATLTPRALGHSFPTGDLFRRVEVSAAWADEPASAVRVGLAREFSNVPARTPHGSLTFVRRQSADTRLAAAGLGPPRVVTLALPGTRRGAVRWSLDHLLMPTPLAASQGVGEPRNRLVVADGTVAPPQGDTP